MARQVDEWVGKTDDTKAPPRVRQRVYDRDNGVCHLCKLEIKVGETWHADHVIAMINGGKNAESNLAPAHAHCHLAKTARDLKQKSKVAKVRAKHTGATKPSSKLSRQKIAKPLLTKSLPPRRLFERIEP